MKVSGNRTHERGVERRMMYFPFDLAQVISLRRGAFLSANRPNRAITGRIVVKKTDFPVLQLLRTAFDIVA